MCTVVMSHVNFNWGMGMAVGHRLKIGWLVVLRIYVASAVFQPYRDLEAGDNQSLKIQVARPGIESRSSCYTSQELNHSATAAPYRLKIRRKKLANNHVFEFNFLSAG